MKDNLKECYSEAYLLNSNLGFYTKEMIDDVYMLEEIRLGFEAHIINEGGANE
jgi:hypothetical protein